MVVLNKIYTRTGDAGTTRSAPASACPSTRRASPPTARWTRPTPCIGVARLHVREAHADVDAMLARIQNDLFDLGADLTMPERGEQPSARASRCA